MDLVAADGESRRDELLEDLANGVDVFLEGARRADEDVIPSWNNDDDNIRFVMNLLCDILMMKFYKISYTKPWHAAMTL